MNLQFEDTPEFIAKRFEQLLSELYIAGEADRAVLNAEYDKLVEMAKKHHGIEAPVYLIDPDLAQTYSDLVKEKHGYRPSLTCSQSEARAYVDGRA